MVLNDAEIVPQIGIEPMTSWSEVLLP